MSVTGTKTGAAQAALPVGRQEDVKLNAIITIITKNIFFNIDTLSKILL
jgi:hypothetical protein